MIAPLAQNQLIMQISDRVQGSARQERMLTAIALAMFHSKAPSQPCVSAFGSGRSSSAAAKPAAAISSSVPASMPPAAGRAPSSVPR